MLNCSVRDYGAVGDGQTYDTQAVQAAIDDCSAHGGGRVVLSEGRFLCGTIRLRDGVDLHIERDAVLLTSKNGEDFPEIETTFWRTQYAPRFNRRCCVYAEGCQDVAITGRGVIDCQGEAYIEPLPPEQAAKAMWPYRRCTTISPARVVFFIGCRNVLVEDVTLRNQPAGWGYWVCDCTDVHFDRAQIQASVLYPNNDGIHVNCSRNVTISNCNIACGDDAIVVRAYSLPLYKNTACEKVAVTNCNLTSHSGGIRVGWINDGVIRNCTFSNLNITDSAVGIDIRLPGNRTGQRQSDEGEEATLIENLNFSDITIDRTYFEPVFIYIAEHNRCTGIRNLYFNNIHAFSCYMPVVFGREDCFVENVYFNNCHFAQVRREDFENNDIGPNGGRDYAMTPYIRHARNVVFTNTVMSVL